MFHEVAHGYAAYRLGDPTAKSQGRLSLNPFAHVDLFGTILLPGLLMLMNGPIFGYAKPVPYNPTYFKDIRKGEAIVGLAGPAANLLMAVLAGVIAWLLYPWAYELVQSSELFVWFYLGFLPSFAMINLCLMFFNLLPIPPLDGSSIIAPFLSNRALVKYYQVQQYALPILMIALIAVPYVFHINPIGVFLNFTAGNLANLLFPFPL